ncbi:Ribonuclease Z 1 [Fulvia fulva]|nr:Ribonuclease Z 1 [Fulvia fulva]KAK4632809.1 Ribonuclease Z 1 [Fulvia fulva]WPV11410.1 Ribonuclease Z 1 [Fulvia fulva]WPV25714.1 Ribonuclease Z 1 [Fulvia fulva]
MRSHVQILTTPTADTPGTTLLLHFDNKRYLIGSLAEGTQRACVQMGARLLKVSECFLTGRTEWTNTGGLVGMILTLADSSASSQASSWEDALKKVKAKAKRDGIMDGTPEMKQLEEQAKKEASNTLTIFGPPNLNHTLATARRFVFRKGMPVNIHEIRDGDTRTQQEDEWAPFWADDNIKVWAMSISPDNPKGASATPPESASPRKRSLDEAFGEKNGTLTVSEDLTQKERDYLTVKAVVSEMFNSSWRLDTLYETSLADVKQPATVFIRNAQTNKLEKYRGPMPGGKEPVPDLNLKVLVRRPWPGALVESLPHVEPAKEAVSYIIRNHMQRGKFHPERAQELKVPKGRAWAQLSKGESVQNSDGETITTEQVLSPSRVGGGVAVISLPGPEYIDNLISRPEWREPKVMEGVGAVTWICGKDVATDPRLQAFMKEFNDLEHVVSSPDYCPNNIALDSATAATVRLRELDPARYSVPVHDAEDGAPQTYGGTSAYQETQTSKPLPARIAVRGQMVQLEPSIEVQTKDAVPALKIAETAAEVPKEVMEEAIKAQQASKIIDSDMQKWLDSLPPGAQDAQVTTLGTGSALPSKYRNVSATLVRVPGWGNILLDAGENTLGQLRRVFGTDLKQILQDLKILWISHMHADHQLGTTSVIKEWYQQVHGSQPASLADQQAGYAAKAQQQRRLAVVSEPAMLQWLYEYSALEDYGHSRLAPLSVTKKGRDRSGLGWFIPPRELKDLSWEDQRARLDEAVLSPSDLGLADIQAVQVRHCHGARAVSITTPSGFKVSYSGDCRPSKDFVRIGKDSTVCIHEATFDDELQGDAEAKNHSTTSEALDIAQKMRAKACVLTHFSQRYQKVPVLERGNEELPADEEMVTTNDESANPDDNMDAPLADVAEQTLPDQPASEGDTGQQYDLPSKVGAAGEAIRFTLTSDMKVCVAFDYMNVRVGDIGHMEKFTPALLKLFAEEDKSQQADVAEKNSANVVGRKEKEKKKGKSQRNN